MTRQVPKTTSTSSLNTTVGEIDTAVTAVYRSFPFWSDTQAATTITGASTAASLPSVTLPNISGWNIQQAYAVLKFRYIDNSSASANAINGDTDVQVKENAAGAYTDCINIVDNSMATDASAESGGDTIIGNIDVSSEVSAMNKTYAFKFDGVKADTSSLVLQDAQTGLIIFYTV